MFILIFYSRIVTFLNHSFLLTPGGKMTVDVLGEFRKRKKSLDSNNLVLRQSCKGKLTAMERIQMLLDKNSFIELYGFVESHDKELERKKRPRDGVITGIGTINKRHVCVYAQDFTFMGGSMGEMHNKKIGKLIEQAIKNKCPFIGLLDSGGARIQEGISALDSGGEIFRLNAKASGIIPQISAILGPCAGIAVYSPCLTDFVFTLDKKSHTLVTGYVKTKKVSGNVTSYKGMCSANTRDDKRCIAHFVARDEKQCMQMIKILLSYLPQNNLECPPVISTNDDPERLNNNLATTVRPNRTYDARSVVMEVLDKKSFLEIQECCAKSVVTGLGRLNDNVVGVVGTQPATQSAWMDVNASDKISKFVRFCDRFNTPLVNFVDSPGFPTNQEDGGVMRHVAKIFYAYSKASTPKISLIMRRAFDGSYIAFASKEMGYDYVIAWPQAEIAVMSAEQAVSVINKKEFTGRHKEQIRKKRIREYKEKFYNPYIGAQQGRVDLIIHPKDTRKTLIKCLEMVKNKKIKAFSTL